MMLRNTINQSRLAALMLVCVSGAVSAHPKDGIGDRNRADARAEVRSVIGAFRRAIIAKDQDGFLALFNPGPVVWQSVDSTATRIARGEPDREPAFRDPAKTSQSFIRGIATSKARIDETMSNIRVESDGEIATASFDFVYSRDQQPLNRGLEAWHLLRTGAGWRIVSVVWSNNPPVHR